MVTAPSALDELRELVAPRLEQFGRLLDASKTAHLTPEDLIDLVLAPVYVTALLTPPGQVATTVDVDRLVDNVIAVLERRRSTATPQRQHHRKRPPPG